MVTMVRAFGSYRIGLELWQRIGVYHKEEEKTMCISYTTSELSQLEATRWEKVKIYTNNHHGSMKLRHIPCFP
jgi:hypothetical protein